MFKNFFFLNRTIYETLWKNTVQPDRPQMTVWRMRIACWIPKFKFVWMHHGVLRYIQEMIRQHNNFLLYKYMLDYMFRPFKWSFFYFIGVLSKSLWRFRQQSYKIT